MTRMAQMLAQSDWPLALAQYNQDRLTQHELQTIDLILQRRARRMNWFEPAQCNLERLISPLVNAMTYSQVKPKYRNALLALLLDCQRQYDEVFWCWSDERWHTVYQLAQARRQRGEVGLHLSLFLHTAYLLTGFTGFNYLPNFDSLKLAQLVFDPKVLAHNTKILVDALIDTGFHTAWCQSWIPRAFAQLCLNAYSPHLSAITLDVIHTARSAKSRRQWHTAYDRIAFILEQMDMLAASLEPTFAPVNAKVIIAQAREHISPDWLDWIDRWLQASPYASSTRRMQYHCLLQVGRWLAHEHPTVTKPEHWTRDLAVTFVAAVDRCKVGDWARFQYKQKQGQPISANTKSRYLAVVRSFFTGLQEWGWIKRRFDPRRCLGVPRAVQGLLGPHPKPIDPAIWKKLVIAALHLKPENLDTPQSGRYAFLMVKALAVVWVFSGLRPDEIRRLPLGCIRYTRETNDQICWLDVPANKRNPAYTKPVDSVLGAAVTAWEHSRPNSPQTIDLKSGQTLAYLFADAGKHISQHYLTRTLIPLLCRAAGVPQTDSYGRITPNRARHTIAYQLANGRDPMPLLELQTWLGHRSPDSTLHYTTRTHLELSQALEQYTVQNTRLATVLVDREAVANGAAAQGQPWKYYDVGHGYCTHDFFETCAHRIACARCASYVPKSSSIPQLQQTHHNLLRMREAIPLTDEMVAAIDEGLGTVAALLDRLADTPTPSGETPHDLGTSAGRELNLIALADIPIR